MKVRKGSIVWKWILWYLIIMLVLIAANVWLYAHGMNSLKEQKQTELSLKLERITLRFESAIRETAALGHVILNEAEFSRVLRERESQLNIAYSKYLMREDLNEKKRMNENFSDIFLYFEDLDLIISSQTSGPANLYWMLNRGNIPISEDIWKSLLQESFSELTLVHANPEREDGGLVCVLTLCYSTYSYQRVNLLVLFDADTMELLTKDSGGRIYVLNQEGEEVGQYGQISEQSTVRVETGTSFGSLILEVPESSFNDSLDQFMVMFLTTMLLSVFLCLLLIFMFVRANYQPVKRLLGLLPQESGSLTEAVKDEYELALERVNHVVKNRKELSKMVSEQRRFFREESLWKILTGEETVINHKELGLCGPYYMVLGFYIDGEEQKDLEISYFVLQNVYTEVLESADIHSEWITRRGLLFAAISGEALGRAVLHPLMQRAADFLQSKYEIEYMMGLSLEHEKTEELTDAYEEVVQIMGFQRSYGMDEVIYYEDFIQNGSSCYVYSFAREQELLTALQQGDRETAMRIYHKVLEENRIQEGNLQGIQFRCLIYDLTGTLYKAIQDHNKAGGLPEKILILQQKMEKEELHRLKPLYEEMVRLVCEMLREEEVSAQTEVFKIQEYIQNNYQDMNLSVGSVAEALGLNAVQMSKNYKKATGEKILSHLSELRCEQAKRLLIETEKNIAQIAEETGFGSTRTFLRVFKQTFGITPTGYREREKKG